MHYPFLSYQNKTFNPMIDYSGQQYCHLKVLYPVNVTKDGKKLMYECVCTKCGKHVTLWMDQVFRYRIRSCGCTQYNDIVGGVFGKLTVIERTTQQDKDRNFKLVCQCECGTKITTIGSSLFKGNTTSCGCTRTQNLVGKVFGRLTVLELTNKRTSQGFKIYKCRCSCPRKSIIEVRSSCLISGQTRSCGCLGPEQSRKYFTKNEKILSYRYETMLQRCYNKSTEAYEDYGARGIKVCDLWYNHKDLFIKWALENGFSIKLSIDRIDVDGNYCPENCRWTTDEHQDHNTRRNPRFVIEGHNWCAWDWSIPCHQDPMFLTTSNILHGKQWCVDYILKNWDRSRDPRFINGRRYIGRN